MGHGKARLGRWRRSARIAIEAIVRPPYSLPGHHTSPIPGSRELEWSLRPQPPVSAIDLNEEGQLQLLKQIRPDWLELASTARRYRDSGVYPASDAIVYYALLRELRPRRIIEVGSGFSSALALDARDQFLPGLEMTCIDPYPQRLDALLQEDDFATVEIIRRPVQDVPLARFDDLEAGDMLFCDTDHFAKLGSEVNWLIFNVLPRLRPGVLVHLHDIFWPFEYPEQWRREGRGYNELYLVRALLMFDKALVIRLFNHWLWVEHRDLFAGLPVDASAPGGLWLETTDTTSGDAT
jgi:predicted O-methyltransferase YrrM